MGALEVGAVATEAARAAPFVLLLDKQPKEEWRPRRPTLDPPVARISKHRNPLAGQLQPLLGEI